LFEHFELTGRGNFNVTEKFESEVIFSGRLPHFISKHL